MSTIVVSDSQIDVCRERIEEINLWSFRRVLAISGVSGHERRQSWKLGKEPEVVALLLVTSEQGSNIRKSKDSRAGPSHGTKAVEPKIATSPHEVVSIEGVDLADFNSDISDSECDGSMEEESLHSDDDAYWYDHPIVGKIHVPPGFIWIL